MTKYRIRLENGRVLGPFVKDQLFDLKAKGHIKGSEEAQVFPTGNWGPISSFDFYADLMDEDKTLLQSKNHNTEQTFVIDLTKLRTQRNEKELEDFDQGTVAPIEHMTETIRMTPSEPKVSLSSLENVTEEVKIDDHGKELERLIDEDESRTIINPVAQQEIDKMRKLQREAEEKKRLEEEARIAAEEAAKSRALEVAQKNEVAIHDESTQMIKLDRIKNDLIEVASAEEEKIEEEFQRIKKKRAEENEEEDEEEEEDEAPQKNKRKKLILIVAALGLMYALLFPSDEKPKKPPFQHLDPQIVFPIPFDQADKKKAQAEFEKGMEFFNKGTYPNIVKAGINFKAAHENDLDNSNALNYLVRTYAEELQHSKNILYDAQTLFNIIQSKRPFIQQDPNGVIGLNLFYMTINKPDAAIDVVQKYLKLNPKNVTQDLFAVYLESLMKQGKIDLAKQFYQALEKASEKNRYSYKALISYMLLNQETDKAMDYVDDAIKNNPQIISFYLMKAELLIQQKKFKEAVPLLQKAEDGMLDYNDHNRAKFLELTGLLLAAQGDAKQATVFLTKSLAIEDSNSLRMKLADLSESSDGKSDTDKLIAESKAIKLLNQAKTFYSEKNYELALSTSARATDAFPGHIPSELFLAKVQLKLGLAAQGLKTLEALVSKYPDHKKINLALIDAYIETYKFNDAKNRIAIISGTPIKESFEYASVNAKLYLQMGDLLQAMSWLKTSISMNPLNDEDIFRLAQILLKKGNFDPARTLLNKAIELDPINPDYRLAYATMIYEQQDDQAAVGYLLSLLDEFGENAKFLSEIAIMYYRAGKVKDFQDYKARIEKLPYKDKSLYEFLIKAALLDERYSEIPGLVEQLLVIEPGDLEAMMTAGRVLFEDGKLVDAAKWFRRVQEKLPSYPKVLYYVARIKLLSRDPDGAMAEIKKDMKENGENDASLVLLAQVYAEKGELIDAENTYKKAQKLNPRSYEALVGLADLSTKRNNFDLALDLYKRAIKQKTDEAIIHKKIGDVYRLLGQGTLAIESYKMYLDMNPEASDKPQIESYIKLMQ